MCPLLFTDQVGHDSVLVFVVTFKYGMKVTLGHSPLAISILKKTQFNLWLIKILTRLPETLNSLGV